MWVDAPGSAKNTLSSKWAETLRNDDKRFGHKLGFAGCREVKTTTIEQLVIEYGPPFFVKIDVEGCELRVLRGMRRPVPYCSFEINLPEFRREGLECIDVLDCLAPEGSFNYTSDCRCGLALDPWLGIRDFRAALDTCAEGSIEVFWKTRLARGYEPVSGHAPDGKPASNVAVTRAS